MPRRFRGCSLRHRQVPPTFPTSSWLSFAPARRHATCAMSCGMRVRRSYACCQRPAMLPAAGSSSWSRQPACAGSGSDLGAQFRGHQDEPQLPPAGRCGSSGRPRPGRPVGTDAGRGPSGLGDHVGSSDVVVASIDTGVDFMHPDLAANMWRNPGEIPGNGIDDDNNGYVDDVYGSTPSTTTLCRWTISAMAPTPQASWRLSATTPRASPVSAGTRASWLSSSSTSLAGAPTPAPSSASTTWSLRSSTTMSTLWRSTPRGADASESSPARGGPAGRRRGHRVLRVGRQRQCRHRQAPEIPCFLLLRQRHLRALRHRQTSGRASPTGAGRALTSARLVSRS